MFEVEIIDKQGKTIYKRYFKHYVFAVSNFRIENKAKHYTDCITLTEFIYKDDELIETKILKGNIFK